MQARGGAREVPSLPLSSGLQEPFEIPRPEVQTAQSFSFQTKKLSYKGHSSSRSHKGGNHTTPSL